MNAYYNIKGLCPNGRGDCGFAIDLSPTWPEAVKLANLDQNKVNHAIQTMGRQWLDGCGFAWIDTYLIRVQWGEWGPEHITVPGDACGLDLSRSIGGFKGGMSLTPHNVDNIRQAHLLLVVFTFFANEIVCG